MKPFFSRIAIATVLASFGLSAFSFNPDTLALANVTQIPDFGKKAKKRVEEEKEKIDAEKGRIEAEKERIREEKERLKEEAERRKEEEKLLKEEEKRLKEEEANRLKEEAERRKEEEKLLKEEEKRLEAEKKLKLKEEAKRLEEEKQLRLREEAERMREERENARAKVDKAPANSLRADGLDIAILMKNSQGIFSPVDPSREFVSGDEFRVEYDSRLDGIVYFVNVDPNGVATVIYRDEVSYGKKYVHPAPEANEVIKFGGSPGIEVLKIIISPREIQELENALRESGGRLGTTKQQVKEDLAGYVAPKQEAGKPCGGLELSSGRAKVDCRDLTVVNKQQDQGKVSVAVAPKIGGTGAGSLSSVKLNQGEAAVLEIRLKHVQ
jgi:actin-related protein